MVVAQQPERAQDVRVALARDDVADGDQRRAALGQDLGQVGAEVDHAGVARAEVAAAVGGPVRVGEHDAGVGEPGADGRVARAGAAAATASTSPPWTETTAGTPGAARRTASPAGAA